jgi:hypothetical protein
MHGSLGGLITSDWGCPIWEEDWVQLFTGSGSPLCQGLGLVALECASALVAVKVVRPVGRSILTAPVRRRGGLAVEAASGF